MSRCKNCDKQNEIRGDRLVQASCDSCSKSLEAERNVIVCANVALLGVV